MAIKYNPYNWNINKVQEYLDTETIKQHNQCNSWCLDKMEREIEKIKDKEYILQIRKDLIEELYDAVNQPYIIEDDINLLIRKLSYYETFFK